MQVGIARAGKVHNAASQAHVGHWMSSSAWPHAISRHVKHAYLRPHLPGCALQPPTNRRHRVHQGQPLHVLQLHSHSLTCLHEHASAQCHQRRFWQLGSQRWQLLMLPCLQIPRSLRSHKLIHKAPDGCFLAAPCAMISFCAGLHATNASPTGRVTNWQVAIAYCNMITPVQHASGTAGPLGFWSRESHLLQRQLPPLLLQGAERQA